MASKSGRSPTRRHGTAQPHAPGRLSGRLEPGSAIALPTRKSQALLAYLALPPGRARSRDTLAALLWGGIRDESARASSRQALFAVRKALSDTLALQQDGDALALEPGAVEVDAATFERLVREGTPAALEQAVELYQGDLLSGFGIEEAPFQEWLLGERERMRELAFEGLAKLLAQQRKVGASAAAVQSALKLLTLDPLQEPVHRTLMRLYAEGGRRGAALRQYQQCVSVLGRELGIEPEPETNALYQEILRERPQHRAAVSGGPAPRVERAPGAGVETTLIGMAHELALVGERFDFSHDRIRETAYGRILAPRRRLLHRRIAEAIEALHAGNLEPHALALGLHYRSAEAWDRAVRDLRQAGVAAVQRAANREAVASLEAALEAVEKMAEGPERSAHAIGLRVNLENALMGLGQFRRSLERLREAEALAHAGGDPRALARVYSRMTYNLGSVGELSAALETGERALALATEQGDVAIALSTNVVLARALYGLGDYRRAIETARRNDTLRPRADDPHGPFNVAFARIWSVLSMAEIGTFAEGGGIGEEVVRAAVARGRRHEEVWARLGLGRLYVVQGSWLRAIGVLEPSLPLCEIGSDLAVYFSRSASSLGEAYVRSERTAEGLALLERAAGHAETIGFTYSQALLVGMLGEGRLLAGDVAGAAHGAALALELARRYGQRGWEAWALRLGAEVAVRREPLDLVTIEARFADATALATELAMPPLLAHCRLGRGMACARAGMKERALEEVESALADYRALDMPYWREQAERALA